MVYEANINKIHAIKRKQVLACIEIAKRHPMIQKLIIFGSSVTDDCLDTSDVDICLSIIGSTRSRELCELTSALVRACDYNCDILKYSKLSDEFKKEIDRNGVLVYELS